MYACIIETGGMVSATSQKVAIACLFVAAPRSHSQFGF